MITTPMESFEETSNGLRGGRDRAKRRRRPRERQTKAPIEASALMLKTRYLFSKVKTPSVSRQEIPFSAWEGIPSSSVPEVMTQQQRKIHRPWRNFR